MTTNTQKRWWRDGETIALVVTYAGITYVAVRVLQGLL